MKRMLLASIAIASALVAGSASAELAAGTDYYGRSRDPYTHHGFKENTGFSPPPGVAGAGGTYGSGGYQSYGGYNGYQNGVMPNCSSNFSANQNSVTANSRCKTSNTPYYVGVGAQAATSILGLVLHDRQVRDANKLAGYQATLAANLEFEKAKLAAANPQLAAPQGAGYANGMVVRRMCQATPSGPVCADVPMMPVYYATPR